jgi:hypothetical protein
VFILQWRSGNSPYVRSRWETNEGKLRKRLAKIEEVLAKKVEEEYLSDCNCGDPKRRVLPFPGINTAVQLRTELALKCPIHQEQRLSGLLTIVFVDPDGRPVANPEVDPRIEEYERRYNHQLEQAPANADENV